MYLVDTDWIIQVLANDIHATRTLRMLAGGRTHVSLATMGELYDGAFTTANPQAELVRLRRFLDRFHILALTDAIMERFAELRAFLRRQGQIIPDFDILIAATALHHNLTLLTFNLRHFQRIPDLALYHPT